MFSTFFKFELNFWLRGMMLYIFVFIIGLLVFAAVSTDEVRIGGGLENTHRNAPHVIQSFYSVMSLVICVMVAAFVNAAASRDFTYDTHQLIYTKPISKLGFLTGRFWGSALIAMIPLLGVSLGIIVAKWMPWVDPERWGPISWPAHFWGFICFAVPNTLMIAAIVFAIAVFTRSSIAAYLGAIGVLLGYSLTGDMISDLDNEQLAMLLDPFAISTFSSLTKYWTVDEKNSSYLALSGILLWNRVLWLSVAAAVFSLTAWRFSFAERRRAGKSTEEPLSAAEVVMPSVHIHEGWAARWTQLLSQISVDFWGIVKSNVFIVVMLVAAFNMIAGLILSTSEGFGISAKPVTYNIVLIIRGNMYLFLVATIVYYTGVVVWKERDARLDEVYDALPHPTWLIFIAKMIAITLVIAIVLSLGILSGIIVQACYGYTRFQLGLYARELLVLDLMRMFFLAVLAMFIHVISPNKYIGYFAFIAVVIANTFMWGPLKIDTRMVRYASIGSYTYSDMYGFAPFAPMLRAFTTYWLLFASLICVAAILWWQRGKERAYSQRFSESLKRSVGPVGAVGIGLFTAWTACAGWVFYNTQIVNELADSEQQVTLRASYEKDFKSQYEGLPTPRVTDVKYEIDVFPYRRALTLRGEQSMTNKTDQPITEMLLVIDDDFENEIEIEGAQLTETFQDYGLQLYVFDPPMQPGDVRSMSYTVSYASEGFENSVSKTEIVQNGTFFNNMIVPQIGYQPGGELRDKSDRKKHDLGEPQPMPPLDPDNLKARGNTYLNNWSDWVNVETVISTAADQIAVAPGSLRESWEQDGRRYFRYVVDHPSLNFYSFISAKYERLAGKWNDVDVEVYYHPEHVWNVPRMRDSIIASLEYCSEEFGPYRHKQARIIEFPRVASFAQAFPGTMPYSEGVGFIADLSDKQDIDKVFYVVAHEMAHQWWAHQVIGANMQGATVLSETLAQYSALMVMEREYGRDMMRKFLRYEMDRYLRSRGREMLKERPLIKVESQQGYIHYQKGSVVMYYLKELIGEDKVNEALRTLIDRFGYAGPPYPTSVDLVEALRAQTPPEYQSVIDDLFEKIILFSNRTLEATVSPTDSGTYHVTLKLECRKFEADEKGAQEELEIDDWIEIGAFAEPEKGEKFGRTLYRERLKISERHPTFEFEVREQPAEVGVDPFSLLIDRVPDDNMKKPKVSR